MIMAAKIYRFNENLPAQYWFHCPGCLHNHAFTVGLPKRGPEDPRWEFNGDFEKPTFSPSLLCNKSDPKSRCHSFVVGGKIQFLTDCWHALADKTVTIPDWEY